MLGLLAIIFVLLVTGAVIGLLLSGRFLSRLRALHPDIWEELGPPTRFFDDGGSACLRAVEEFFRRREFRSRCCADVLRIAERTQVYGQVYTRVAVITFLTSLFLLWQSGL